MGQSGGTGVGCVVESSGHIGSGGGVVWHELHVGLVGLSEIYVKRGPVSWLAGPSERAK